MERARHDRSTTYVGVYGGRGKGVLGFYRAISSPSSASCCCHRAMRHSNRAKDAPRSSPIGCNAAWHMRIPLHKREHQLHRWRESDGAIREATSPTRAAQKRHTANHRCVRVCKSARKSISPLIQLLQWRASDREQQQHLDLERAAKQKTQTGLRDPTSCLLPTSHPTTPEITARLGARSIDRRCLLTQCRSRCTVLEGDGLFGVTGCCGCGCCGGCRSP